MPIDANLIANLAPAPVRLNTPFDALKEMFATRDLQQAEQQKAKDAARAQAGQAAVTQALAAAKRPDGTIDFDRAIATVTPDFPEIGEALQKNLDAHRKSAADAKKAELDNDNLEASAVAQTLNGVKKAADPSAAYAAAVQTMPSIAEKVGPQYDPNAVEAAIRRAEAVKDQNADEKTRIDEALGGKALNATAWMLAHAQTPDQWTDALHFGSLYGVPDQQLGLFGEFSPEHAKRAMDLVPMTPTEITNRLNATTAAANAAKTPPGFTLGQGQTRFDAQGNKVASVAPRPVASGSSPAASPTDAKAVADAIMSGDQPPEFTGLYRNTMAVRAELAKAQYPLTKAVEDWTATKKYLGTLNGAQQTRLRQATQFAGDSLDLVQSLSDEWKGGQFPLLNKAHLAAAKQGLYGPQAQSLATRLDAQISDLVSELGTVYKGGNSSTDESLQLAAKNLSADWSQQTLSDAIAQVRTNLKIRQNSIRNTPAAGTTDNQYDAMRESGAPSPTTGAGAGVRVQGKDGKMYQFPTQAAADAFKKAGG
jgi:hypothetical protein